MSRLSRKESRPVGRTRTRAVTIGDGRDDPMTIVARIVIAQSRMDTGIAASSDDVTIFRPTPVYVAGADACPSSSSLLLRKKERRSSHRHRRPANPHGYRESGSDDLPEDRHRPSSIVTKRYAPQRSSVGDARSLDDRQDEGARTHRHPAHVGFRQDNASVFSLLPTAGGARGGIASETATPGRCARASAASSRCHALASENATPGRSTLGRLPAM